MDFAELIYRQVESDTLDYKAHQSWNTMNAAGRGKFVRHLAAFANTAGGVLVVGVGEDRSGCPCDYTGLTEEPKRSRSRTSATRSRSSAGTPGYRCRCASRKKS